MKPWQNGTFRGMPKRPDETTNDPAASEAQRQAGLRLQAIRKLAGIKQAEIAEAFGVDQSTWSKWEKGIRAPDLFVMTRFAARAKTSLDLIYRGLPIGTHPALVKLLRLQIPDLVAPDPIDRDQNMDTALASYRSSIARETTD